MKNTLTLLFGFIAAAFVFTNVPAETILKIDDGGLGLKFGNPYDGKGKGTFKIFPSTGEVTHTDGSGSDNFSIFDSDNNKVGILVIEYGTSTHKRNHFKDFYHHECIKQEGNIKYSIGLQKADINGRCVDNIKKESGIPDEFTVILEDSKPNMPQKFKI